MSIPRRGEGRCPGPPRPRWGGGAGAPRIGDAPRGELGEETQPLFRGGPGAIPTTRVSKEDTSDLTETPGWAIPEGRESSGPPKGRRLYWRSAWGAQSPPGRAGSGWCQAGREETGPRGCCPERYTTPPPRARTGCYWLLRDTGTPLPQLHGGREFPDTISASVPFSPWRQSQSGGEGAVEGSQLVAWVGGGAEGQDAWVEEGWESEAKTGHRSHLPIWCPPAHSGLRLTSLEALGKRAEGWRETLIYLCAPPQTQSPHRR